MPKTVSVDFSDAEWKVLLHDFSDPEQAIIGFWRGSAEERVRNFLLQARSNGATGTDAEILAGDIETALEREARLGSE